MRVEQDSVEQTSRVRSALGAVLLMAFGVAFALLLIEVAIRALFPSLPPEMRGDLQAVRRVPWSEERLIPQVPFILDRTFQARLEPGIEDYPVQWQDASFRFSTGTVWEGHSIGLRTDGPTWPLDILAFGDSFTFCWTAVEDCWVQRLGSDHGWNVVNAGLPGTGTRGQLALLRDIGGALEPGVVIWQWYPNDLSDNYQLARINDEAESLPGPPAPDPAPEPTGLARYSALVWLLELAFNRPEPTTPYEHFQTMPVEGREMLVSTAEYPNPYAPVYETVLDGWTRTLAAFEAGAAYIDETVSAEMVLVLIPTKEEAYAAALEDDLGADYLTQIGETRRMLLDECAERGWHCIDALPAFQEAVAEGETVYYALDFHLDASGNRVLSDLIAEYIREHDLLAAAESS